MITVIIGLILAINLFIIGVIYSPDSFILLLVFLNVLLIHLIFMFFYNKLIESKRLSK